MINREATIRWKGYDPDDLSEKSNKRVWANCENCGRGRWVVKGHYSDLCKSCSIIKTSKDPIWIENQKTGIEKMVKDPIWIENQKKAGKMRIKNPLWIEGNKRGVKKRSENPKWIENIKIGDKKRSENPEWIENNKKANREKSKDPIWIENQKKGCEKRSEDITYRERISAGQQGIPYDEWTEFSHADTTHWHNIIYLNDRFSGCHRHHITATLVVCIPAGLHNHISHCLKTGHNMYEINVLALQYIFGDINEY